MTTLSSFSIDDRTRVLRFAASFLWADFVVVDSERTFLATLAKELDIGPTEVDLLLLRPPIPEDVDPSAVRPALADVVRDAALRAIAADGRVDEGEMQMFELLDALLPRGGKS